MESINAFPVQINLGIDGFLKEHVNEKPVPVKIQGDLETVDDAIEKLEKAFKGCVYALKIIVQTRECDSNRLFKFQTDVKLINSLGLQAKELYKDSVSKTAYALAK